MTAFRFTDAPSGQAGFVANVPAVHGKDALLAALYLALRAPAASGRNWDALFDVLCDLDWLPDAGVTIVHHALPDLPDDELRSYLGLLSDSAMRWAGPDTRGRPHRLTACFPLAARSRVESLLGPEARDLMR